MASEEQSLSPDPPRTQAGAGPSPSPPPIPKQSAGLGPGPGRSILAGRLHPLTPVFRAWQLVRGMLIPAILLLLFGNERVMGSFLLLFMAVPMVWAVVRYLTFSYRLEGGELVLRHGVLGRKERHIPLNRVQDIRIERGLLHRLLGMADIQVDTAGGEGPDASLSVLSQGEAERLRAALFESGRSLEGRAWPGDSAAGTGAPGEARETIRKLSARELVLAGLTSNKLASILALLLVAERLSNDFVSDQARTRFLSAAVRAAEEWIKNGPEHAWLVFVGGAVGLTLVGMILSVVASVAMFYGFTLSRAGEDLHRSYGLLTRRSSSLPRRRVQVLKVEEKLLRRLFRLATVRVDTAGRQTAEKGRESEGRDVLLPVVPRAEVDRLLPAVFPDWDGEGAEWQRVSRRAIWRGTAKGALVCLGAAGLTFWRRPDWLGLWPLALIPLVALVSMVSYRHLGYGLSRYYFRTRRGWLGRATHVVPIRNAQVIEVSETPFDRRHGVATLVVHTAGQAYTGGGPRIGNVPAAKALALARQIAHGAAATRFRV